MLSEIKKEIRNYSLSPKVLISNFDLEFLATAYLAALYEKVIEQKELSFTTRDELTTAAVVVRDMYEALPDDIKSYVSRSGVPTLTSLNNRWVAARSFSMTHAQFTDGIRSRLLDILEGVHLDTHG